MLIQHDAVCCSCKLLLCHATHAYQYTLLMTFAALSHSPPQAIYTCNTDAKAAYLLSVISRLHLVYRTIAFCDLL